MFDMVGNLELSNFVLLFLHIIQILIGLLGSYNNRDHNFELTMLSLVILYIPFLSTNFFPYLKRCKEGMS